MLKWLRERVVNPEFLKGSTEIATREEMAAVATALDTTKDEVAAKASKTELQKLTKDTSDVTLRRIKQHVKGLVTKNLIADASTGGGILPYDHTKQELGGLKLAVDEYKKAADLALVHDLGLKQAWLDSAARSEIAVLDAEAAADVGETVELALVMDGLLLEVLETQAALQEQSADNPEIAIESYEPALKVLSSMLDGYSSSLESIIRKALVVPPGE